jgi:hypothetical protein
MKSPTNSGRAQADSISAAVAGTRQHCPAKAPDTKPLPPKSVNPASRSRASVAGVSISGLSDAAAQKRLRAALASKLSAPLLLSDGSNTFRLRRDQLGASIPYSSLIAQAQRSGGDVPLRFALIRARA